MKIVAMTRQQAEWAGRSVAVAGGWIAVTCPRLPDRYIPNADNTDGTTVPGGIVALVPDDWTSCIREIDRDEAKKHLMEYGDRDGVELAATL